MGVHHEARAQVTRESQQPRRMQLGFAEIHQGHCLLPTNIGSWRAQLLFHHYYHLLWYEYPKATLLWEKQD